MGMETPKRSVVPDPGRKKYFHSCVTAPSTCANKICSMVVSLKITDTADAVIGTDRSDHCNRQSHPTVCCLREYEYNYQRNISLMWGALTRHSDVSKHSSFRACLLLPRSRTLGSQPSCQMCAHQLNQMAMHHFHQIALHTAEKRTFSDSFPPLRYSARGVGASLRRTPARHVSARMCCTDCLRCAALHLDPALLCTARSDVPACMMNTLKLVQHSCRRKNWHTSGRIGRTMWQWMRQFPSSYHCQLANSCLHDGASAETSASRNIPVSIHSKSP